MAIDLEPHPETTLTSIVSGIIGDFQELVKQQLDLFRSEVTADLRKTKEGATFLAVGSAALLLGMALLCVMFVLFLSWLVPAWPLWVFYLLVGGCVAVFGLVMALIGLNQFRSVSADQSIQSLEENLEWKTKPR